MAIDITVVSIAIGNEIPSAVFRSSLFILKKDLIFIILTKSQRLSHLFLNFTIEANLRPLSKSSFKGFKDFLKLKYGERNAKYTKKIHTINSATAVPSAAPATPQPHPLKVSPKIFISLKIKIKLKITSSKHIKALKILGTFIFPVLCNILLDMSFS